MLCRLKKGKHLKASIGKSKIRAVIFDGSYFAFRECRVSRDVQMLENYRNISQVVL